MNEERGLWICLDGPDYSGKRIQTSLLADTLTSWHEDNDVLITHEPTYRNREIKRKLKEDKDALSDSLRLAFLYVEDRVLHEEEIIKPNLRKGVIVISNRHKCSTDAYQSAQGVHLNDLVGLQKSKGVSTPDLTLFLDVDPQNLRKRMELARNKLDKFERDFEFQIRVAEQYRKIYGISKTDVGYFGNIVMIDGNLDVPEVASEVKTIVSPFYKKWADNRYQNS